MASSRSITATTLCALVLSACSGGDDIASQSDETIDPEPAATSTTDVAPDSAESAPSSTATDEVDSPEADASADNPTTTSTTNPPPPPLVLPTQTLIAVDDNDVAEPIEVAVGAPASYEELIEVGIEAGYWDEIGGIERVLGYALGVVDASQVPGIETVTETDISGVLGHANELALGDEYSADELALIEQRYEWFAPSAEALDQATVGTPNGLRGIHGFSAPGAASGGCANFDPDMMDSDAYIADCYDVVASSIPGADIRVFTPSWFADDATAANIAPTALAAIEHSLETYRDLGEIGDVDMVFSDSAMTESDGVHASATVTRQWGSVTVAGCPVTMFGSSWGGGPTALEQTIAHEIWHCVQHYDGFPMHVPGGTAWYREGGATYFSNVAYPSHDHEIARLSRFDYRSLSTPLHELSYETWIWWQYVGNAYGPLYVADLHREMMNAGGNGASVIADLEDMFHEFVVHLAAAKVRDQDGKFLPKAGYYMSLDTVTEGQEGRKIEMQTKPFTAARWHIYYDKELRVLQTDTTGTDGTLSMVEAPDRYTVENWEQVFPEVRSKCTDRAHYAMIGTDFSADQTFEITVDTIEEASCDPCLLGTWSLQLDTFGDMIIAAVEAEGESMPPGMSMEFAGAYYFAFDENSGMQQQRDNLQIIMSAPQGSFTTTINGFAVGEYTADGERITVTDVVEIANNVSVDAPIGVSTSAPFVLEHGAGDYTCDDDLLVMTGDGFEPVTFDRVDKILTPPEGTVTQQP